MSSKIKFIDSSLSLAFFQDWTISFSVMPEIKISPYNSGFKFDIFRPRPKNTILLSLSLSTRSKPGLFLLKLPALRNRTASIVIEVNPVDTSGSPTKKRGIIIKSNSELVQIRDILTNVKLEQLTKSVEEVNPEVKTVSKSASNFLNLRKEQ